MTENYTLNETFLLEKLTEILRKQPIKE